MAVGQVSNTASGGMPGSEAWTLNYIISLHHSFEQIHGMGDFLSLITAVSPVSRIMLGIYRILMCLFKNL